MERDSRYAAGQLQLAAAKRINCFPLTRAVVRAALAAEACYVGRAMRRSGASGTTVEYVEKLASYFAQFGVDSLFAPEHAVAKRVVALMRETNHANRFAQIVNEVQANDAIPHHGGSNAVTFPSSARIVVVQVQE